MQRIALLGQRIALEAPIPENTELPLPQDFEEDTLDSNLEISEGESLGEEPEEDKKSEDLFAASTPENDQLRILSSSVLPLFSFISLLALSAMIIKSCIGRSF